jgi:hypothetical protein
MIELLTNPALYAATSALIVVGLAREWKTEQSRRLFRGTLALALVGNVLMLGATIC